MTIYDRYADIYDRSGQVSFSLRMIPYLLEVLDRRGFAGASMLDLACGTGTVAVAFAGRGWQVYGVDGSAQMLAHARRQADEAGANVWFSQQDMRSFVLPQRVDLVTCLYDSLNYLLTAEDLQATCVRVAAALKPDGLFVFDMNTIWALAELWDSNTYFHEVAGLSIIMQSEYDKEAHTASVRVIAFAPRDDLFERIEETHIERAYPERTIVAALDRSGLQVLDRYECFTTDPPTSRSPRILWIATPTP